MDSRRQWVKSCHADPRIVWTTVGQYISYFPANTLGNPVWLSQVVIAFHDAINNYVQNSTIVADALAPLGAKASATIVSILLLLWSNKISIHTELAT